MVFDFPPQEIIAYGYSREESVPYPAYPSGAREKENPIYTYPTKDENFPLLLVEEDLINSEGLGLKRGFYQTQLDETGDFLLLFQSGRLRAKVPVISIEQRKQNPPTKDKPKKAKREKKNYKGIDSKDFVYQKAELFYDKGQECYIIFWDRANTRAKALLRLN